MSEKTFTYEGKLHWYIGWFFILCGFFLCFTKEELEDLQKVLDVINAKVK